MIYTKRSILAAFFLFFISISVMGQKPIVYESPKFEFDNALELLQKEKYGAAQQYFKWVYEHTTDKQQDLKTDSYFYLGLCAAALFHDDAIFLLQNFIDQYPVSAQVPQAYFALGKFYFHKKNYKKTIESFDLVGEKNIAKENRAEYSYKKGYSYFELGKFAEARPFLKSASQLESPYTNRAHYYLAVVAYQEKQYQAALEGFEKVQNDTEFKDNVPLYIVQIYLIQKKYLLIVEKGLPLYEKSNDKNKIDIARCLAIAYFNEKNFEKAADYFSIYFTKTKDKVERHDWYSAGLTNYELKNYQNTIDYLSKTTSVSDKLAQNAWYIIANCNLLISQNDLASQAFYEAYKMDFLPEIKEDALYNYAKLQFETSAQPFNNAIRALEQYMNEFPNSAHTDEVESYLSKIYISTKNYQGAINSLEKIQQKSTTLLAAYQRCTHLRGLELINNKEYSNALKNFVKSELFPIDKSLQTKNLFWKAEAEYRAGQFENAAQSYKFYQRNSLALKDPHYVQSIYDLGYSLLRSEKFVEAENSFVTFLSQKTIGSEIRADAQARLADCQFMQKKVEQAINNYDKCAKLNENNADYALFQMGIGYGYLKEISQKVKVLNTLLEKYPKTAYRPEAEFELAGAYHALNQYDKAIECYSQFITKYPKNGMVRKAYNKLAQAYWNKNDDKQAIKQFKFVIENFQGSQEAKDAIANMENIYAELGNSAEFYEYAKSKNLTFTDSRKDSMTYKAAENKYLRKDYEGANKGFADYLKQFSNGLFTPNALFYKAEYDYEKNRLEEALESYEILISKYNTENNEVALRKSALIHFNKKGFEKAFDYFSKLNEMATSENNRVLANNGLMRAGYELKKFATVRNAAEYVINSSQAQREVKNDGYLFAGRACMELNDFNCAKLNFNFLAQSPVNENSTEAAYKIAKIELLQNNLADAEKQILKIINGDFRGEYWIAATYILYGDLYVASNKKFQAKTTYQSIIDNYEGEDLKQIAKEKLQQLGE